MKKIIFIFIAVFTFSMVSAQDVSFGLKAGVNLASQNSSVSDFNDILKSRTAFHAGGVIDISFSDKFSVQPEILFNSVGATWDFSSGGMRRADDSTSADFIANYLSVPVMAKYYVAEGFSLKAGPQIGFLLAAKAKNGSDEEDFKDQMESTDISGAFGAGYKMDNGLFFDARYVLGLSNTFKNTGSDWVKNNVFQFSVGYLFN